jgi:hypothetical protein
MIKRPVEYPGEAKRSDVGRGGVMVASPPQKPEIRPKTYPPLDRYLDIDEVVVSKGGQRVMFAGSGVEDPLSREEAEYYILDNINVWSGALRLSGDVKKKLGKIVEYHKRDVDENVQRYSTRVGIFNYGVIPRQFAPVPLREEPKALAVEKPRRIVKAKWTSEEARRLGDAVGLSVGRGSMRWKELVKPVKAKGLMGYPTEYPVDLDEFRMGLEAEAEHADVTGGNPLKTALIALAHLREKPDYYSKLKVFEAS